MIEIKEVSEKGVDLADYNIIREGLKDLYVSDQRPWIVGFSGGKDSTMVASLIYEAVSGIPQEQRTKPIAILCSDTRVEIPAIVEMIEGTLVRMRQHSNDNQLNIEVHLLKPPAEQSFWVNIIGRGYPPPNRTFRWCTQRLKIDPVSTFVNQRTAQWGESILHLGARKAESASRARSLKSRDKMNGLRRHEDLARVWISNPIEDLTTEEVWAYLLQSPNPWGSSNSALYRLYANASGGECPLVVDKNTPSCGNSRFGCWTCTVVERDKASEGLLASGDERMEKLIDFRETLSWYRDPANGQRDKHRMNGAEGNGPLHIEARKSLLAKLLELEKTSGMSILSQEELYEIQRFWNSARQPDDGDGVARIFANNHGDAMSEKKNNQLREIEFAVATEKEINPDTLRRMIQKVADYGESHRAMGLPDDLLRILQDDLAGIPTEQQE